MRGKILSLVLALVLSVVFPGFALAQTTNNNNNPQNNSNNPGREGSTGNPGTSNSASAGNSSASAPKNPMTVVHAFNPAVITSGGGASSVRARVNNWTNSHQMKLVCVEALKVGGGNNHLGCLSVHLMPKMATDGDWAREFDTPVTSLGTGSYRVMYTYQDDKGAWFPVTSLEGGAVNTNLSK